jgi:hypothetical protein
MSETEFDGVTPDMKRAAEKRAAAIAADRGEVATTAVEAAEAAEPSDAKPKKSRGQTTR